MRVGSVRRPRGRGTRRGRSPLSRLTGERPVEGRTPDSLLALHDAGYEAVAGRLGPGTVLDVGCGQGFESARLAGPGRVVIGVDYELASLRQARAVHGDALRAVAADASALAVASATVDWVCSSHLIEHLDDPGPHVGELARVLRPTGTAFVLTPNAPADFENPFHVHLFDPPALRRALEARFAHVWVGGLEGSPAVKTDFARRRARADRLLALDVFGLRRRLPHRWYVAAYTRLLPLAYRLLARSDAGGTTGITAGDFFVTEDVDPTTPVLFAVAGAPRTAA